MPALHKAASITSSHSHVYFFSRFSIQNQDSYLPKPPDHGYFVKLRHAKLLLFGSSLCDGHQLCVTATQGGLLGWLRREGRDTDRLLRPHQFGQAFLIQRPHHSRKAAILCGPIHCFASFPHLSHQHLSLQVTRTPRVFLPARRLTGDVGLVGHRHHHNCLPEQFVTWLCLGQVL